MAVAAQGQPERLRLGKVIGNTAAFIGRNLIFALVVGALFFVLPAMLARLGVAFWYWSRLPFSGYGGHWAIEVLMLAGRLLAVASGFLGCAVFSCAVVDDIKGNRPSVGSCVRAALRHTLPIVGTGFAIYLAFFFSGYALLRAGLLTLSEALAAFFVLIALFTPWGLGISIAVPVATREGLGVSASMTRSLALTRGNRWAIFGLFLIVIVLFFVRQVGLGLVLLFALTALATGSALIASAILDALVLATIWIAISVALATTYIELRRIKEGSSVDELSEIFS